MKKVFSKATVAASLALACGAASAAPYYWTDWLGGDLDAGAGFQAQGTITTSSSTVGVTYTNPLGVSFYQSSPSTDWWAGGTSATSPYTSTQVDNRPTGTDIIALRYAGTQTLQFSQAIANPVFSFVSLNGNGYEFDQDFEILSLGGVDGNVCGYWGCGGASRVVVDIGGGVLRYQLNSGGGEPHGTIRFLGTFATLTWRSSSDENWNGFTMGVQGTATEVCPPGSTEPGCNPGTSVPEPGTLAMLGLGLAGLAFTRRRKH